MAADLPSRCAKETHLSHQAPLSGHGAKFSRSPSPSPQRWYEVSAFPRVPGDAYMFGTSGRNVLDGRGMLTMNLSFSRNFVVHERNTFQLRGEALSPPPPKRAACRSR